MSDHLIKSDFVEASEARWLDAVEKALKGARIDTLTSTEPGGLTRQALYTAQNTAVETPTQAGQFPFTRSARGQNNAHLPWHIAQRVIPGRKGCDNAAILTDLMGGASALTLDLSMAPEPAMIEALMSNVMLDIIALNISSGTEYQAASQILDHIYDAQNISAENRLAYLNADPIGAAARQNLSVTNLDDLTALSRWGADYPQIKLFCADGRVFHDAGASEAQELGCMAANIVAMIRHLSTHNSDTPTEVHFRQMTLGLAADVDFFATIAKFRAARSIWARITEACGSSPVAPSLIADTSERCFATADPWVNILRATVSAVGAALGSCDVLTVAPCTSISDADNALSRRIARNTHIILQEESHFGHVVDPAGGAWYIEQLTTDLTRSGWAFFQSIEAQGGLMQAIASGWLAEQIAQTRNTRSDAIARRKIARIGVTEFPNLEEAPLTPRAPQGSGPLGEQRDVEKFEDLRHHAQPVKPKVFLATLGTQAEFSARANFASNLYAVAGVNSVTGDGGNDLSQIIDAFKASGCKIACICGTDSAYDAQADAVAVALKEAGAVHLTLAGKPREIEPIDDYCFAGCDTFVFATQIHHTLGLEG